jgi:hypothetical protein
MVAILLNTGVNGCLHVKYYNLTYSYNYSNIRNIEKYSFTKTAVIMFVICCAGSSSCNAVVLNSFDVYGDHNRNSMVHI